MPDLHVDAHREMIAGIRFFVRPDIVKQVEKRDGVPSEEAKMQSDYDGFRPRLLEGILSFCRLEW